MMAELVRYDEMCRAIDAAYEVDEVKDIRDKAIAIEIYAKQAKNTEAERRACEIRLRAERRAGQLLSEMEKAKGGQPYQSTGSTSGPVEKPPRLADLGISKKQSSSWQQLARVPEKQFEAVLAGPDKPSANGILRKTSEPSSSQPKQEPMNPKALWLWGRLRDFEREGILDSDPQTLLSEMTDAMRADVERLAPVVADWLNGACNRPRLASNRRTPAPSPLCVKAAADRAEARARRENA